MRDLKILVTLRKYSSVGQFYDPLMLQMRHRDGTAEIFQSDCWLGQRKGTLLSEHQTCSHVPVRGTNILHLSEINTPFRWLRFCTESKQNLQASEILSALKDN